MLVRAMTLAADLTRLLLRELAAFEREIDLFPDDETLWAVVPGIANPAGTLALHIAGNLQYFVGAVLGGTGYVRNREAEFSARGLTRDGVRAELRAATTAVRHALPGLTDEALRQPYPAAPGGLAVRTDLWLMHLVAHTAFHLGQAGYLRRCVTQDTTSAGPLPLPPLAADA